MLSKPFGGICIYEFDATPSAGLLRVWGPVNASCFLISIIIDAGNCSGVSFMRLMLMKGQLAWQIPQASAGANM